MPADVWVKQGQQHVSTVKAPLPSPAQKKLNTFVIIASEVNAQILKVLIQKSMSRCPADALVRSPCTKCTGHRFIGPSSSCRNAPPTNPAA
mmetsp:Transcript_14524/g.23274  ORF Transcript_14524/g.23274 Transcript_14524/m.23274 type:complete len:91 (-) Transcript_14524:709-981(-)